jgi:hypothetical protein
MKWILWISCLLCCVSCTTYNIYQTEPVAQTPEEPVAQTPVQELPKTVEESSKKELPPRADHRLTPEEEQANIQKAQNEVGGSPVAYAVQTMKKAEQDMQKSLQLIELLKKGDQTLDCKNNLQNSLQTIESFFNASFFTYDEVTFWFLTNDNKRVGVFEEDGILATCKIGLFSEYKRLVAIQYRGQDTVKTEFYIQPAKGELMIHRYINGARVQNENYNLLGF